MAYILGRMYRYFQSPEADTWLHVPRFLEQLKGTRSDTRGGDYAKLRFWGLLTAKSEIREDGSDRAGFWRVTEKGEKFVRGVISVPRIAHTYNNTVAHFSEERTDIFRSLGDKYDYNEMMDLGRE